MNTRSDNARRAGSRAEINRRALHNARPEGETILAAERGGKGPRNVVHVRFRVGSASQSISHPPSRVRPAKKLGGRKRQRERERGGGEYEAESSMVLLLPR